MKRGLALLLLAVLAGALLSPARNAFGAQSFAYRWFAPLTEAEPRVTLRWREGRISGEETAYLNLLGHLKRTAVSLWPAEGEPGPLRMEATFYGPEHESGEPRFLAAADDRVAEVEAPYGHPQLRAALQRLAPAAEMPATLTDDGYPRLSDDGEWLAFMTWRAGSPEIWVAGLRSAALYRIPAPGGRELPNRLLAGPPVWAPDAPRLAFVQGRRLCVVSVDRPTAELVTPLDFQVADFAWSPGPTRPLAVRSTDGRLLLVDLQERRLIPVAELLEDVEVRGSLSWSPSGRRLVFRGAKEGEADERLYTLDVPRREFSDRELAGTPLTRGWITGILWGPEEETLYVALERARLQHVLLRVPLAEEDVSSVLSTGSPIRPIGWRSAPAADGEAAPAPRLAFLAGSAMMLADPGDADSISIPYSPRSMAALPLPAGPLGGYLGDEDEAITGAEPGQRLFLESSRNTGGSGTRRRVVGGLHANLPLNHVVVAALRELARGDDSVLDVDVSPEPERLAVMAMVGAADGGTARLMLLDRAPDEEPAAARRRDFSAEITGRRMTPLAVNPDPYPTATDAAEALAELARRLGGGG